MKSTDALVHACKLIPNDRERCSLSESLCLSRRETDFGGMAENLSIVLRTTHLTMR